MNIVNNAKTPKSRVVRLTPEQTDDTDYQETQMWRNQGEIYNLSWYINAPQVTS